MYESLPLPTPTCPVTAAWVIILAVLLGLWALPVHATQTSTQFDVLINLQTDGGVPNSGLCRSSTQVGTFGDAVTVICSSGEIVGLSSDATVLPVIQAGTYRFVILTPSSAESLGKVNTYAGLGPVSSWHKVNVAGLDYLELTISW
jgi:hypothetical protein